MAWSWNSSVAAGSLHDKLQRLRRPAPDLLVPPEPGTRPSERPPGPLERLEASLLGQASTEPTLKARLERLVEAAMRRERRSAPAGVPLEELVEGMRVENERGEFFLIETDVHLEVRG